MNETLPPAPARSAPGLVALTTTERVLVIEPQPFVCVYDINTDPADTAVTVAEIEPVPVTDAIAGLLLVHVPPGEAVPTFINNCVGATIDMLNDVLGATNAKPVAAGNALTVTTAVRLQVFVHV